MLRAHRLPLLLAAAVTLLNAVKPAVVDDTAYLLIARHIATDPLHPYSFELFWYYQPEPAMEILAPPVLPYWLAAGIALFGENLPLLKLWLFPFAWLLCSAVRSLLRRFAAGVADEGTIAFCLSPAVLPLFNVMLDIPALALGAAAITLQVKACDGKRVWAVLLAGVCCGLAMQTKFTMLTVPCVMLGYGLTRFGKPRETLTMVYAIAAVLLAIALFALWEWYLVEVHKQSHFLFHLKGNAGGDTPFADKIYERLTYAPLLLGQFGGLAGGVSLAASAGLGWPRVVRITTAILIGAVLVAFLLVPYSETIPFGPRYDLPYMTFLTLGVSVVVTGLVGLVRVLLRRAADADTLFLVGWLMVEVVGMLGMTPFPAARRVIGVCLAAMVLLFHLASKLGQGRSVLPRWGVGFAVGLGLLVWAVDWWDSRAEKELARKAAETVKPARGEVVWFTGHWGFQWYCDLAGMQHLNPWPGGTPMKAGDWLVSPVSPDGHWFYRPCPMNISDAVYDRQTGERVWQETDFFPRTSMELEWVGEWVWLDGLSGQTIPNLYGGSGATIRGRDHPRLRVAVYRVKLDWMP